MVQKFVQSFFDVGDHFSDETTISVEVISFCRDDIGNDGREHPKGVGLRLKMESDKD
jgi:hypothetical protein